MATKKPAPYVSKAKTTKISATSRCALKTPNDAYFTIEAHEEREIEDSDKVNLEKEWELLFDSVNAVCDKQSEEIINVYFEKKK